MASDSSSRSSHSARDRKRPRDAEALLIDHRMRHGMCPKCGMNIYETTRDEGRRRLLPITIPNLVERGRCLLCYPMPKGMNEEDERSTATTAATSNGGGVVNSVAPNMVIVKTEPEPQVDEYSTSLVVANPSPVETPPPSQRRRTSHGVEESSSTRTSPRTTSLKDADGVIFVGTVTEGTLQKGRGTFTHLHVQGEHKGKVSVYEGEFENGLFHGEGTSRDAAGCTYEGTFRKGAAHGFGTCNWEQQGWRYEGEWLRDKRHGNGTCRQVADGGEVYTGMWKKDQWDGPGKLIFAGGGEYHGEFKRDKLQGVGRYFFADGSVYDGSFRNDLREGHGSMVYTDRSRYDGEWSNNWRNGTGTLYHPDGSFFKGSFRGDEKDGYGFLHLPDGIVRRERWVDGVLQHDSK